MLPDGRRLPPVVDVGDFWRFLVWTAARAVARLAGYDLDSCLKNAYERGYRDAIKGRDPQVYTRIRW